MAEKKKPKEKRKVEAKPEVAQVDTEERSCQDEDVSQTSDSLSKLSLENQQLENKDSLP